FVEDAAVPPERLPEFTARFSDILHKHGTEGAYYGHASVGCLHIRPLLNLKDTADVATMRRITEEVTDLVLEFNGCLSGEHGNGACRKLQGGTMCPSYRATRDERDTTRARANALRLAISGQAPPDGNGHGGLGGRWVYEVMDLCLMCKACKAECPSNVDVAK